MSGRPHNHLRTVYRPPHSTREAIDQQHGAARGKARREATTKTTSYFTVMRGTATEGKEGREQTTQQPTEPTEKEEQKSTTDNRTIYPNTTTNRTGREGTTEMEIRQQNSLSHTHKDGHATETTPEGENQNRR